MRWTFLLTLALCWSCQQPAAQTESESEPPTYAQIVELQKQLLSGQPDTIDTELASRIVKMSDQFATANPADSLTAEVLFKGGDIARGMGNAGKAIEMWGRVWRNHPTTTQGPFALFFQGFTFENDLQDKDMARKYYQQFLEKYPEHELAAQVELLMANLDKTPEQLLEEIRQRNAGQTENGQ